MIIGFTQRAQRVSESMAQLGDVFFPLPIHVATMRTAEREYPMYFRVLGASSSAIVEPIGAVVDQLYDATFGTRDIIRDPIKVFFVLEALQDTISPLTTFIRNDLRPEYEECFTIRIFPVDIPGNQVLFSCYDDYYGEDNYFCEHTICIMDDDGWSATFNK